MESKSIYKGKSIYKICYERKIMNDIIKEELQNFLNERYEYINEAYAVKDDRFKFKQVINADFYNYETFSSNYDADISTTPITINWSINFILNPQGVENFNVEINGVEGFYVLNFLDKQTDEVKQQTQKNITDVDWHFNINTIDIEYGGGLYVTDLDFDFKNKTCSVSF